MKIYNFTQSVLIIPVGGTRVRVEPRTCSNSIIFTPSVVKAIQPLINMYGSDIILVPNTSDQLIFEQPGCGVPADNLSDLQAADCKLNKIIKDYQNKVKDHNKPVETKTDRPKDDLNAGLPTEFNQETPEIEVPKVEIIPGSHNK